VWQAMQKIAATHSVFVSRGDDSGTNAKEKGSVGQSRRGAGRCVVPVHRPGHGRDAAGGQREGGYTLSDRATYLAQRDTLALQVLSQGTRACSTSTT
jgi:tungstate transport system substrate-binding protein